MARERKACLEKLFKEANEKTSLLVEHSFSKESKQIEYLNRLRLYDKQKKIYFQMSYSTEKKYKEYAQRVSQKVFTIENMARQKGLVPVFITLTLPSSFHPFKSKGGVYNKVNLRFKYDSLDNAIKEGYQELNEIHKLLYKRVKHYAKKNCYYIKTVEPHKSFLPHFHCVYFVPHEFVDDVYRTFQTLKKKDNLGRSEMQQSRVKKGITNASAYLLKYITKNLKDSSDVAKMRLIDGWKRKYKIRLFSCSQLPIPGAILDKLYKSSTNANINRINSKKEYKIANVEEILRKEVLTKGISYYFYFLKNSYVKKCLFNEDNNLIKVSEHGDQSASFKVYWDVERYRINDKYVYKTLSLKIQYRGVDIYNDKQFIKL